MKKLLAGIIVIFMSLSAVYAKGFAAADFSTVINESGVEKNSIAISIKNLNSGKSVYELNEKILMHPASVQKLLTLPADVDVLGENYEFETTLFRRSDNSYVVKLGADPYLTSKDLKKLVSRINADSVKKSFH